LTVIDDCFHAISDGLTRNIAVYNKHNIAQKWAAVCGIQYSAEFSLFTEGVT
jgi:hypothetical protein